MGFWPGARDVRLCLGIVVTAISAVACAPAPDRARHTVAELRADRALREREFKACANDSDGLGKSAECLNVTEAERLEDVGSLRELPPLKLPGHTQ
jgi:hypothetical protein